LNGAKKKIRLNQIQWAEGRRRAAQPLELGGVMFDFSFLKFFIPKNQTRKRTEEQTNR
jgi:hypothetical protein